MIMRYVQNMTNAESVDIVHACIDAYKAKSMYVSDNYVHRQGKRCREWSALAENAKPPATGACKQASIHPPISSSHWSARPVCRLGSRPTFPARIGIPARQQHQPSSPSATRGPTGASFSSCGPDGLLWPIRADQLQPNSEADLSLSLFCIVHVLWVSC